MATMLKTKEKSTSDRQANELFLKMTLDCECLTDEQIKMLAGIANVYFEQSRFRKKLKKVPTSEGPNVP